MASALDIKDQITLYLDRLTYQQKVAVLNVVETFVADADGQDPWNDDSFLAEMQGNRF